MINKYYKIVCDRIDNLYSISQGNDGKSRFFHAQTGQLDKMFSKLIELIIEKNTQKRDINSSLRHENDILKEKIKVLKKKYGISTAKKPFQNKYFPFIK